MRKLQIDANGPEDGCCQMFLFEKVVIYGWVALGGRAPCSLK